MEFAINHLVVILSSETMSHASVLLVKRNQLLMFDKRRLAMIKFKNSGSKEKKQNKEHISLYACKAG